MCIIVDTTIKLTSNAFAVPPNFWKNRMARKTVTLNSFSFLCFTYFGKSRNEEENKRVSSSSFFYGRTAIDPLGSAYLH